MSQVTVTDVSDISAMETDDIRKWISMHRRALKDDSMAKYHDAIRDDMSVLLDEYELRNPLVPVLREICEVLKSIDISLNQLKKEKENGTTTD